MVAEAHDGDSVFCFFLAPQIYVLPIYGTSPIVYWFACRMEQQAGEMEGKLSCPNKSCGARLGSLKWTGAQCSCEAECCMAHSLEL